MWKLTVSIFFAFSSICFLLGVLYLFLIGGYLLATGGNYSMTYEAGDGGQWTACGSILQREDWLWILFELLGAPFFITAASFRTAQVFYRRLSRLKSKH